MAEPVRRIAAGPAAPGWAGARREIAVAMRALPAAFADWLDSGCDDASPAAAVLDIVVGVVRRLDETVQGAVVGEATVEAACERAVEEDRAARPPARRRGRGDLRAL